MPVKSSMKSNWPLARLEAAGGRTEAVRTLEALRLTAETTCGCVGLRVIALARLTCTCRPATWPLETISEKEEAAGTVAAWATCCTEPAEHPGVPGETWVQ